MTGTVAMIDQTANLRKQARKVWNTKLAAYDAAFATLEAAVAHDDEIASLRHECRRTGDWTLLTHEQNESAREAREQANREAFDALQAWNISVAEWHIADRNHYQARVNAAQEVGNWVDFYKLKKRTQSADRKAATAIKTACAYWEGAARRAIYEPLFAKLRPNCEG